jgi:hypothetical protein
MPLHWSKRLRDLLAVSTLSFLIIGLTIPGLAFAQASSCLCTITGTGIVSGRSPSELASLATSDQRSEARSGCENAPLSGRFDPSVFSCTISRACEPSFAESLNRAIGSNPVRASCATRAAAAGTTTPPATPPTTPPTTTVQSPADEAIAGGTEPAAQRPFTPIPPNPAVPIPGVRFTPATEEGGIISVPYLAQYISGIYRLSVGLGAILAAIMIVYGGFRYMLSASAPGVSDGKTIIQDAFIGLVVLLSSFLILKTINPKLVEMNPVRVQHVQAIPPSDDSAYDSIARDADPDRSAEEGATGTATGAGPARFCRQTLAARPRPNNSTVWCAACQSQVSCGTTIVGGPDPACPALIGRCGGSYGQFLASVTGNCTGKTFRSLEGLDGGTYGILGYMQQNLPQLMRKLQQKDAAVYNRVVTAGNNRDTSASALCASNQTDRGFICNADYRNMLQTALPTRAFALAQLQDSYEKYSQRVRAAASHGFRSSYGQAMWATVANNPGRCGAGFGIVLEACRSHSGASESERIDCFLEKFVELGCRGGVPGARRRADSIRQELRNVSRTDSVAPPTLEQLEACIPNY